MTDIERIKSNIKSMIDQGAPEGDIDAYLGHEGVTLDSLQTPVAPENTKPADWNNRRSVQMLNKVGDWMENFRQRATTPSDQGTGTVPEWAGKSPTAYGLLGAARESVLPVAQNAMLSTKFTPAGILTGGLGYAGVGQVASLMDKVLGNKGPTTFGQQLGQAGKETFEGAAIKTAFEAPGILGRGIVKGYKGAESAVKEVLTPTTTASIDKEIEKTVSNVLPKAIRPSNKNLVTAEQTGENYYKKVTPAIQDVVENKNAYEFMDKKGNPVNLPQTVADQKQVIGIGKDKWWGKAVELREQATGQGAVLDVKPIVQKLDDVYAKNELSIVPNANVQKYILEAKKKMEQYTDTGMSLKAAQEDLSMLNNKIFGKGVQVGYDSYGIKEVDQFVASQIRKGMDSIVEGTNGDKAFQEAKKLFGSYKTMEEDTIRRANQIAKQPKYSMFDISDIWIGYHTGAALLTGNVPSLVAALGAEGAKKYMKSMMSSDHLIKAMYEKVDKLTMAKKAIAMKPISTPVAPRQSFANKQQDVATGKIKTTQVNPPSRTGFKDYKNLTEQK